MRNVKYFCWPYDNDGWAAGLVQVEQTITCTLAGCNLNRHAYWSSTTVLSNPVSWVHNNIHYCWFNVNKTHDWWPLVSLTDMCAGSVPHNWTRLMVRMSDVMTWWYYMDAPWNFNRYACRLGTIQSDMPPGPLKVKEKSNSTDAS